MFDFKRNLHNLGRDNSSHCPVITEFYGHSTSEQEAKITGCCKSFTRSCMLNVCFPVVTLESTFIDFFKHTLYIYKGVILFY